MFTSCKETFGYPNFPEAWFAYMREWKKSCNTRFQIKIKKLNLKESNRNMKSRNALFRTPPAAGNAAGGTKKNYVSEVWVADQGSGKYKNPILHADYSDPDACRVGDDFYMTSSSFNPPAGSADFHSKPRCWVSSALPFQRPPLSKHRNVRNMATVYGRLPSAIITVNSTFLG